MRTFDFSPLLRHSIGFDRMQRLLDAAAQMDTSANSYPPYNIEQVSEDGYRISMAESWTAPAQPAPAQPAEPPAQGTVQDSATDQPPETETP